MIATGFYRTAITMSGLINILIVGGLVWYGIAHNKPFDAGFIALLASIATTGAISLLGVRRWERDDQGD